MPLYLERKLVSKLKISRADLRWIRSEILKEGSDWSILGRDTVLNDSGLTLVLDHLEKIGGAILPTDFSDCIMENHDGKNGHAAAADPNAPLELTITKVYRNPRLVRCTRPDGTLVDCRVKTNLKFVPHMKLTARPLPNGQFQMEGRCPRIRGRY